MSATLPPCKLCGASQPEPTTWTHLYGPLSRRYVRACRGPGATPANVCPECLGQVRWANPALVRS